MKLSEYILENMQKVYIHGTKARKRIILDLQRFIDTTYDKFMRNMAGRIFSNKNMMSNGFLKRIDEVYESELHGREDYFNYKNIMNNLGNMEICMNNRKKNRIGFTDHKLIGTFMMRIYKPCSEEKDKIIISILGRKNLYIRDEKYSFVERSIIEKGEIPGIELLMIPEIETAILQQSDNNYYYRGNETLRYTKGSDKYYVLRVSKEYYEMDRMNDTHTNMWNEVERSNLGAV